MKRFGDEFLSSGRDIAAVLRRREESSDNEGSRRITRPLRQGSEVLKYLLGYKFVQLCLQLYEMEMTGFERRDYTSIFTGAESRRGEGIVDAREVSSMEEGVCSKWTF